MRLKLETFVHHAGNALRYASGRRTLISCFRRVNSIINDNSSTFSCIRDKTSNK